jgi:hypothetical protein
MLLLTPFFAAAGLGGRMPSAHLIQPVLGHQVNTTIANAN